MHATSTSWHAELMERRKRDDSTLSANRLRSADPEPSKLIVYSQINDYVRRIFYTYYWSAFRTERTRFTEFAYSCSEFQRATTDVREQTWYAEQIAWSWFEPDTIDMEARAFLAEHGSLICEFALDELEVILDILGKHRAREVFDSWITLRVPEKYLRIRHQ